MSIYLTFTEDEAGVLCKILEGGRISIGPKPQYITFYIGRNKLIQMLMNTSNSPRILWVARADFTSSTP